MVLLKVLKLVENLLLRVDNFHFPFLKQTSLNFYIKNHL